MRSNRTLALLTVAALAATLAMPATAAGPINLFAEVKLAPDVLVVQPLMGHGGFKVAMSGPNGFVREESFTSGAANLDLSGLGDGAYSFEVSFAPVLSDETRAAMAAARASGDEAAILDLMNSGAIPSEPRVMTGNFTIAGGAPVLDMDEPAGPKMQNISGEALTNIYGEDQQILDDLIVDGSACVGFDCVNGESFGFDTIRVKENNLRIHFQDTSNSASFPSNDWRLTANETTNGGNNWFTIEDSTAGRNVFIVEAGARTNALYLEADGDLGLGTNSPVGDIHIKTGNTPTLRLEQDGTSGFTPQTWDVAGNEANFFVRDATNGSTLPFKIFPGAPSNALTVEATTGDIGLGTTSPDASLDIEGSDVDMKINDLQAGVANRTLATFSNNGPITVFYENRADGTTWGLNALNGGFAISLNGSGQNEMQVLENGNVEAFGNFTGGVVMPSSRKLKTGFQAVDPIEILSKVQSLELTTWHYDRGRPTDEARHLGPIAEDFWAAFGLGEGETTISPLDTNGVALAAIQGLAQKLDEKDQLIAELIERLEALEAAAE